MNDTYFFIFFTNLSFCGLVTYFFYQAGFGIYVYFFKNSDLEYLELPLNPLERFIWILFEVMTVCAWFLDLVFWVLLFNGGNPGYYNVSAHAINSLWMIIELVINRLIILPAHYLFDFNYVLIYMFYSWMLHAGAGYWVYPFLSWSNGPLLTTGYYIGVYLLNLVFYFAAVGITFLKNKLLTRYGYTTPKETKPKSDIEMQSKPKEDSNP